DSISPQQTKVSKTEGESVTLHCSYSKSSSNYYYLYWYRQYPRQSPEFILYRGESERSDTKADFAKERFSSSTTDKSTALTIQTLTLSDTAVYYCALSVWNCISFELKWYKQSKNNVTDLRVVNPGGPDTVTISSVSSELEVSQLPSSLSVMEGETAVLHCSYSFTTIQSLQWYRQRTNNSPEKLLVMAVTGTVSENQERFSSAVSKRRGTATLTISRVLLEDSTIYYCALQYT
uniref:Ig-like domain-containing protein n=1 Tax=Lepisosteus oculatus TaxID=7918 RepID=W5MFK2_LEPOC